MLVISSTDGAALLSADASFWLRDAGVVFAQSVPKETIRDVTQALLPTHVVYTQHYSRDKKTLYLLTALRREGRIVPEGCDAVTRVDPNVATGYHLESNGQENAHAVVLGANCFVNVEAEHPDPSRVVEHASKLSRFCVACIASHDLACIGANAGNGVEECTVPGDVVAWEVSL